MRRTPARQYELLGVAPIREKPNTIAGCKRNLRQRQRSGRGLIQLGITTHTAALQAARVEDNPDGLALLHFVEPRDQRAATCGGSPADVADLVAFEVIAQAFKIATQA